jgi:hypothetical protein
MVSPQEPSAPPARAAVKRTPPTPARLQKRKLTLAEAADQWEKAKREAERAKALLEEAAPVLLAHFEKTGRSTYKDRIARKATGGTWSSARPRSARTSGPGCTNSRSGRSPAGRFSCSSSTAVEQRSGPKSRGTARRVWRNDWRKSATRSWVGFPHSFPSTAESVRGRQSDLTPISVVAQESRTVVQASPDGSP